MDARTAHFEALYTARRDPWDYETSPYEAAKYAATLNALRRPRYGRALELGCSVGVLTEQLADRVDALVAIDLAPTAVAAAVARIGGRPGVEVICAEAPAWWPDGSFDLIVLSEILYYLDDAETARLAARVAASGDAVECVLVNWLGDTATRLSGHAAAHRFITGLRGLREVEVVVHDAPGTYAHHTLVLRTT